MTAQKQDPQKKALLVGINEYSDPRVPPLRGCLNDVTNVLHVLKTYFGFANKEVRVLTNTMATDVGIRKGLEWLCADAPAGSMRIFHFSGHGSRVPDENGDERDGRDEVLCPHDVDWNAGRYITDDYLSEVIASVDPAAHLEFVLDCCHSGTGTRSISMADDAYAPLGDVGALQPRYLSPPLGIELRRDGDDDGAVKRRARLSRRDRSQAHVLWAAAADTQQSMDAMIHGRATGAFTYYFCKHLRSAAGKGRRAELLKQIRASLRAGRFGHTPQLEAAPEQARGNVFERSRGHSD